MGSASWFTCLCHRVSIGTRPGGPQARLGKQGLDALEVDRLERIGPEVNLADFLVAAAATDPGQPLGYFRYRQLLRGVDTAAAPGDLSRQVLSFPGDANLTTEPGRGKGKKGDQNEEGS